MAVQRFATAHELVPQIWAEGLEAEVLKKISVMGVIGKRSDACMQWRDRLSKEPGDTERVGLRLQLNTAPKTTGVSVEGNEQTLDFSYMDIKLDEYAEAVRWGNIIDRQRVTFEMRDEAMAAIADVLANAFDRSFFNQVSGVSDVGGSTTFEGHNTINAPSSFRGS